MPQENIPQEKRAISLPNPTVSHDEHADHMEVAHIHKQHGSSSSSQEGIPYAEHGPGIDHKIPQEDAVPEHPELLWSRIRHFMREPFSEFFGVFILILFGNGVVAQVVLSNGLKGAYQSISWGWGIGVMLGVYASGV
jgi:aquaglyceroporin related protein